MQGHSSGCSKGNRLGAIQVKHSWLFASAGVAVGNLIVTGTNQKLMTIPASTANPVLYTVRIIDIVANTAAGAVTAAIGTTSAGTDIIGASSLKATAGTNYTTANAFIYAEADTDIWLNYTVASGTDAAGKFAIVVDAFEVNVTNVNTLEA